jgi:hypothetical protein
MIIDRHCHAAMATASLARGHSRSIEAFGAPPAGIDRTVLLAAFHSDYGIANRKWRTSCRPDASTALPSSMRSATAAKSSRWFGRWRDTPSSE